MTDTNNYMMYFSTPNEYVLGGYEVMKSWRVVGDGVGCSRY
jgi:hypothetical protein